MSCCGGPRTGKEFDFNNEGPSEDDLCRFGSDVHRCESCDAEMFASATICPVCGHAQSSASGAARRWLLVAAMIALLAMVAWLGLPLL